MKFDDIYNSVVNERIYRPGDTKEIRGITFVRTRSGSWARAKTPKTTGDYAAADIEASRIANRPSLKQAVSGGLKRTVGGVDKFLGDVSKPVKKLFPPKSKAVYGGSDIRGIGPTRGPKRFRGRAAGRTKPTLKGLFSKLFGGGGTVDPNAPMILPDE